MTSDGIQYLFGDKKTPEQRKMESSDDVTARCILMELDRLEELEELKRRAGLFLKSNSATGCSYTFNSSS